MELLKGEEVGNKVAVPAVNILLSWKVNLCRNLFGGYREESIKRLHIRTIPLFMWKFIITKNLMFLKFWMRTVCRYVRLNFGHTFVPSSVRKAVRKYEVRVLIRHRNAWNNNERFRKTIYDFIKIPYYFISALIILSGNELDGLFLFPTRSTIGLIAVARIR